jgi:hypothetical protein
VVSRLGARTLRFVLPIVLAGWGVAANPADVPTPATETPHRAVTHFYAQHFSRGMAFTEASLEAQATLLTPDLLALCRAYLKKPQSPDEVPEIDGDPFTDSQEYPKSFRVEPSVVSGKTAKVPVIFSWPNHRRTVRVELIEQGGRWLINDILYGDSGSFRRLLSSGS